MAGAGARPVGSSAGPSAGSLDLRLVGGAAAAWLVTALSLSWPAGLGLAVGAGVTVLAIAVLPRRHRLAATVALVLGCAGAASLATAARVAARDASPLARLAAERAAVRVDLVVTDDPRPVGATAPGGRRQVMLATRVVRASARGRSWAASGRVLVFGADDGWRRLLPSQRLRAAGRLGAAQGGDLTIAVLSARGPPAAVSPPARVHRVAGRLREGLRDAAAGLPGGADGLLPGLVIGDTSGLDPVLEADFRTVGLSHLVAVSGANCAIVTGAVLLLLRLARAGPRLSAAAAGAALVGFVILARPTPSVLRAAAMGGIALVALAVGRLRAGVPALAAAVLVLVIASPTLAREPGFALSVAATAALLVVAPPIADRLRRRGVPAGVAEAIAIPVAAQAATAPVVVAIGGQVGLVAIPANLVAMPAVPPATVLGVLAALAAPVSAELAGVLAFLAGLPTRWLIEVGRSAARMPGAVVGWPGGLLGGAALPAAIVVLALLVRVAGRRLALAAAAGALLAFVPTQVLRPGWPPPGWIAVACDVGQGDALVIRAGAGAAVVVDSGPDPVAVDGCLRRLRISRVPLVVLSHLHADHIGGLAGVLRGRAVGAIQVGILREPVSAWRQVEQAARARGLPVLPARVGELRRVEGVAIEVVAPSVAFRGTRSDPNNSSVIVRVRARGHSLLLGGDAEVEAQQAIERAGTDLRADVLKVPHHGSAYQNPSFLTAVDPSVAVVSVGRGNDYGHPSPGVLAHLARTGARMFRTDRDGDVAVCDDGGRLTVATRGRAPPP